ncbi:MAG TPA: hydrogenase maturation protease [Caldilineae bacterium]|nr:hydrogenase maturation protease [Caldilineae bacterium]HIQ11821.1 hydrogenase maturation protease [Caldilineales bacterium]
MDTPKPFSLLILGIGNAWASDDGVGPEVVRRVQAWWNGLERNATGEVGFVIMAQPDLSLIDLMADCDQLIIVDGVMSGAKPGTWHRQVWRAGMLGEKGLARASSHGFGVKELLEMAEALGTLPARVELWGIEIALIAPGQGLSPEVAGAVDDVVRALEAWLLRRDAP